MHKRAPRSIGWPWHRVHIPAYLRRLSWDLRDVAGHGLLGPVRQRTPCLPLIRVAARDDRLQVEMCGQRHMYDLHSPSPAACMRQVRPLHWPLGATKVREFFFVRSCGLK